jgi:ABC-2 type transport system ATP-binding protein
MSINALEVRGLRKEFGRMVAVEGLDLEIQSGELFGLVGPDGAGKTTALRMLATIMLPTRGGGKVAGFDLVREAEAVKSRIGYMPQRFSLYGELSVRENLEFFADIFKVFGAERRERFRQVLEFSRLEPFQDRLARDLSGGMRQKLALSCTLVHTPELLFLDEPTTGVDPISRRELWKLLLLLWRRGTTILVTTPYMDEAERCQRIGFLQGGRLLEVGTPSRFKTRYPYHVIELACEERQRACSAILDHSGVQGVEIFGDRIHVKVDSAETWIPKLGRILSSRGIAFQAARRVPPSVEDVFLHIARGGDGP